MPSAGLEVLLHRRSCGTTLGEPRLTRDIDLTILAEFGNEEPVIDGLLGRFTARFDNAREFDAIRSHLRR